MTVVVDAGFWRDRNVLVTGHTGFKGAWLTLWLQALGARVTGFADTIPTTPSRKRGRYSSRWGSRC